MNGIKESSVVQVAMRILGWGAAMLGGALLTLLLTSGAEREKVNTHTREIAALQAQVADMQKDYATNKRVDDVQTEVRGNYRDLSEKLDKVYQLLLTRAR